MNFRIALIAFLTTILAGAVIIAPLNWPAGFIFWVILVVTTLLIIVKWHSINTVYACPSCGHMFSINLFTDLASPHGLNRNGGWKILTCPRCGEYVRATVLMRKNDCKSTNNHNPDSMTAPNNQPDRDQINYTS